MKAKAIRWSLLAAIAVLFIAPTAVLAAGVTVLTVPWVPSNPTIPHTTYATSSTTEATIIMGATVPSAVGSTDSFSVDWTFGDGSPDATFALSNPYDISTTHQYPASATVGTIWIATVKVTDTTNSTSGSANYYVIQESNDCTTFNPQNQPICVSTRANVAIDWGLWYMHRTMWRGTTTVGSNTVNWGGWDTSGHTCNAINGQSYDCGPYGVVDAENVQAFEVNGHLQTGTGSSTDPYADDVARGLARAMSFIATQANISNTYNYDPSKASFTCADKSIPTTGDPTCSAHGGQHQYNSGATSCTAPPCTITFDGNKNGLMAYSNDGSGETTYTTSPFLDALVAAGTPAATVTTGPYVTAGCTTPPCSYATVIQDIMDWYGYDQWYEDLDVTSGYIRGDSPYAGGAWLYGPGQGDDDSTSQWAAIGFISGFRGAGLAIPPIITDTNNVWITNAQDVQDPAPTGPNPFSKGDNGGAYGYRGSFTYSNAWGPFAVTPSAMVQMAMDGIGRTKNTTFGDGSTDFDQRWNNTESFYADNFCNPVSPYNQAYYAPRGYMYGMFSFTKSMLEHNEGGSLAAIQYLRTLTSNVFTGNPGVPANTIDWYAALSAGSGGKDLCDGVAQTLINYQDAPAYAATGTSNFGQAGFDGHWFGNTYDVASSAQSAYETAWALIMLKGTVFVACVNNLYGRGTPGSGTPPRVDLTWTNQANATSYIVSRSSTSGGPYTQVGTTTGTAFSDRTAGLANGGTYYYVVFPEINTAEVCQSNQATVKIPNR